MSFVLALCKQSMIAVLICLVCSGLGGPPDYNLREPKEQDERASTESTSSPEPLSTRRDNDVHVCKPPNIPRYGSIKPLSASYPASETVSVVCGTGNDRVQLPRDVQELVCLPNGEWKMKKKGEEWSMKKRADVHNTATGLGDSNSVLDCVGIVGDNPLARELAIEYGKTLQLNLTVYYGISGPPIIRLNVKGEDDFIKIDRTDHNTKDKVDKVTLLIEKPGTYVCTVEIGRDMINNAMKSTIVKQFIVVGVCKSELVEGYTWAPANYATLATVPCRGIQGNVNRMCGEQGKWGEPDYDDCESSCAGTARCWLPGQKQCVDKTRFLQEMMENITASTAEVLSDALVELSPTILSASEAELVIECSNKMGDVTGYQNLRVEKNMLVTYDTLLKHNVLTPLSITRVFDQIEKFTRIYKFNTNDQNVAINSGRGSASSISVQIQSIESSSFNGKQLTISDHTMVDFPGELKNETSPTMVLSVVTYQGSFVSDMFPSKQKRSRDMVSISLRDTEVKGLKEPVKFTFPSPPQGYQIACVWWSGEVWSSDGCRGTEQSGGFSCSCNHLTNFALMMTPHQEIIDDLSTTLLTICCLSLSVFGGLATILTILLIRNLRRSKSSQVHMSLAIAVLGASMSNLIGMFVTRTALPCIISAFLKQFFYLSVMSWSMAEAITMYMAFVTVFGSSGSMWHLCIPAWGAPLCISLLTILLGEENYTKELCWLNKSSIWWGFLGFVYGVVLVNIVLFVFILKAVYSSNNAKLTKAETTDMIARVRQAAAVMVLLSVGWSIGILFNSVEVAKQAVVSYMFILVNATQGLYIYLLHIVSRADVRAHYLRLLGKRNTSTNSSAAKSTNVTMVTNITMATNLTMASKCQESLILDNKCFVEDVTSVSDTVKPTKTIQVHSYEQASLSDCDAGPSGENSSCGGKDSLFGGDIETDGNIYTAGGVYAGEIRSSSPLSAGYGGTNMVVYHGQGDTTMRRIARDKDGIIEIQVKKYKEEEIVFRERPSARISRVSDFSRDMCFSAGSDSETE